MTAPTADMGLIGLAVMGENLVLNMESRGFTVAVFNILVQWDGLPLDEHGCAHRSLAQFSL